MLNNLATPLPPFAFFFVFFVLKVAGWYVRALRFHRTIGNRNVNAIE
jgi:hypothetical protein